MRQRWLAKQLMPDTRYSEYAARNSGPILEVLQYELAGKSNLLEIGSGTGQHAVAFSAELPHLQWQTSDLEENHGSIQARVRGSNLPNLLQPLTLDVRTATLASGCYDCAFSANTAHIMSVSAVEHLFGMLGTALAKGGIFCLYGPFRQRGLFNAESNARFDRNLRASDSAMGIRDLEMLDEFGRDNGLNRSRLYAMPANNHCAVWQKALT